MRKRALIFIYLRLIFSALIFFIFCVNDSKAQFFQGVGLTLGANMSNQRWQIDTLDYNQNQKFKFGFSGSVFVEYINREYVRMITEVQYFQEGSKSKITGNTIKTDYACFNNFLKLRQELYDVTPYFLIGPKFKYLVGQSGIAGFRPMHFSMYAGIGMEFLYKRPWIFFVEAGYDHDINRALKQEYIAITNKTICLRVGLKYHIKKKVKGCRTGGFKLDFPKSSD
jgi:hypothetical protein